MFLAAWLLIILGSSLVAYAPASELPLAFIGGGCLGTSIVLARWSGENA